MASESRVRYRAGLVVLLLVPAAAIVALAVGAASPVSGLLAAAGLVLAAERLVALRRTGPADRVLVGVGGVLVALILTGIAMDAVGVRLRPASWTVALVVLTVAGLVIAAVRPARDPSDAAVAVDASGAPVGVPAGPTSGRRTAAWTGVRALPWIAVAVVATVLAVHVSAVSLARSDEPPLQMSFGKVSGSQVQVVVSSTDAVGPLEVRTSSGGDQISYPLFSLGHDGSRTTTLTVPRTGRFKITLSYPDQTEPLRTLILDR